MKIQPTKEDENHRSRGLGFFASQDYNVGDCIHLEESPLITLAPNSLEQENELIQVLENTTNTNTAKQKNNKNNRRCLWDSICVPDTVSMEYVGKFKGMVQAGLCFWNLKSKGHVDSTTEQLLLELYYPRDQKGKGKEESRSISEEEREIVDIAKLAIQYIVEKTAKGQRQQPRIMEDHQLLQAVMLIWSCNSFEGGQIYQFLSRINHSCNPNAIVVGPDSSQSSDDTKQQQKQQQWIRAIGPIRSGDEITISYLGSLLYAEKPIRREILQREKHFACVCRRCELEENDPTRDVASWVPCPHCHPRISSNGRRGGGGGGRQLDEDTQYDDDQLVSYVCGWSLASSPSCPSSSCPGKAKKSGDGDKNNNNDDDRQLTCAMQQTRDMVVTFLQNNRKSSRRSPPRKRQKIIHDSNYKRDDEDDEEEDEDDDEDDDSLREDVLDHHLRLASSVMGARHWTTNLLLSLKLDEILRSMHQTLLFHIGNNKHSDDTVQDITSDLAEAIDMLQRLVRFVDGFPTNVLSMEDRKGHFLARAILGTARALVGLGDVKSQLYAKEWIESIRMYVERFESPGMQKVVETISNAWKRERTDSEDPLPLAKKNAKEHKTRSTS